MFSSWFGGSSAKLPYEAGQTRESPEAIASWWTLRDGKHKSTGDEVSLFECDLRAHAAHATLARNAVKRTKTLRHPYTLSYIADDATEERLVLVTEPVRPLGEVLAEIAARGWQDADRALVAWGVFQVAKALSFLSRDCGVRHGALNIGSVFVTRGGDWKLGGFDFVEPLEGPAGDLEAILPRKYTAPEGIGASLGAWQLGCLIREAFGGSMRSAADLRETSAVPEKLRPSYQKLLSSAPGKRLSPAALCESPFFRTPYIKTCLFLENLALKDGYERDSFFKSLPKFCDELPAACCRYKLLPELLKSVEFAGASNWNLLAALLKVGVHLPQDEYLVKIAPIVVKYFECNDRALRIALLQHLDEYVDKLSPSLINDKLFGPISSGFSDSNPQLRELTVKAMLPLVPRLNAATVDNQVMKMFAKLQVDKEPGIRTNTTICLGRIAPHLTPTTRAKVLAAAFARAMRDPFAPGRIAGLAALTSTMRFYSLETIAKRVVPSIAALAADKDEKVRKKAFVALRSFVDRLEELAAGSVEVDEAVAQVDATDSGSMLGWISKKIYGGSSTDGEKSAAKDDKKPDESSSSSTASTAPPSKSAPAKTAFAAPASQSRSSASAASDFASKPKSAPKASINLNATRTSSADVEAEDGDGWDDFDIDDDLAGDDDDNNNNSSAFQPKSKSPYIGMDDDEDDDEDDDDGQWDFAPARVVKPAAASSGGAAAARRRGGGKAD